MDIVFIDICDNKEIFNISNYNQKNINIIKIKLGKKFIENLLLFETHINIRKKNKDNKDNKNISKKNKLSTLKIDNLFCYIRCIYYYDLSIKYSKKIKNYINDGIIIYSTEIQKNNYNIYIEKYLLNKCKYKGIEHKNTIKENVFKNIDLFITKNDINKNKLRILLILDNIFNLDYNKIIECIQKYKFLDILCVNNNLVEIQKNIRNINNEYGTSIEIINRFNILNYDIYININVDKGYFFEHYIVNKKSRYIDLNDSSTDEYNICYINYEQYINQKNFNISVDSDRYSMLDIGYMYKKYKDLTNSI